MLAAQFLIIYSTIHFILFQILNLEKQKTIWKLNVIIFLALVIIDVLRQLHYGYQPVRDYDGVIGFFLLFVTIMNQLGNIKSYRNWVMSGGAIYVFLFIRMTATLFLFGFLNIEFTLVYTHGFYALLATASVVPLIIILYLLTKFLKLKIDIYAISWKEVVFIVFFTYVFGFFMTTVNNFSVYGGFGVLMDFFALLSGIMTIYFVLYLLTQKSMINEVKDREERQEIIFYQQEVHYKRLIAKDDEFSAFKHNITEEVNFLSNLLTNDDISDYHVRKQALAYINEMKTTLICAHQLAGIDTGSMAVSSSWFSLISNENYQNISAEWKGKIPSNFNMSNRNQLLLFSNLLNNAFEAACKSAESKFVTVIVKSTESERVFTVIIKNSYCGEIKKNESGELITTKSDKKNHGLGTKIIQKIMMASHGEIEYFFEKNECIVSLILPKIDKNRPNDM